MPIKFPKEVFTTSPLPMMPMMDVQQLLKDHYAKESEYRNPQGTPTKGIPSSWLK